MALAFGGGVRPELGRTDYSAIARGSEVAAQMAGRGAEAMGRGLAGALEGAGQAVRNYQERKQAKEFKKQTISNLEQYVKDNPEITKLLPFSLDFSDKKAVEVGISGLSAKGDFEEGTALLMQLKQQYGAAQMQAQQVEQRREQAVTHARTAYPNNPRAAEFAAADPDAYYKAVGESIKPQTVAPGAMLIQPLTEELIERDSAAMQALRQRASEAGLKPGTDEYREFMRSGGVPEPRDTEREQRIARMMERGDITRIEAIEIVDGIKRIVTDSVTGAASIVDVITGDARRVNEAMPIQPLSQLEPLPEGASLYDIGQRVTGVGASVLAFMQRVVGLGGQLLDLDANIPGAEDIIAGRQIIDASNQALVRSLALSPRFNQMEMERIRKEMDVSAATFTDPRTLAAKMRGIDSYLRTILAAEERAAYDRNLSANDRAAALSSADSIQRYLNILGANRIPMQPSSPKSDSNANNIDLGGGFTLKN